MELSDLDKKYEKLSYQPSTIESCEKEPLMHCGAIMPYGLLFVVDSKTWMIKGVSENWSALANETPIQALYNSSISEILIPEITDTLDNILSENLEPKNFVPMEVQIPTINAEFKGLLHIHASNDCFLFEVEFIEGSKKLTYSNLYKLNQILEHAPTLREAMQGFLEEMLSVTEVDRAVVFKLEVNGHGGVIAEAQNGDNHAPLQGLKFPESDIPKICKAMSLSKRFRAIMNVYSDPVPILSEEISVGNLDISNANLRFSSPYHLQFMKNMNVKGCYSLPLRVNGQLWGFIALHHSSPFHLSKEVRDFLESASRLLIGRVIDDRMQTQASIKNRVFNNLKSFKGTPNSPHEIGAFLTELTSSNSVYMRVNQEGQLLGDGPSEAFVEKLISRLKFNSELKIWTSDCLMEDLDMEPHPKASGALVLPLSPELDDYIIWFRSEEYQEVEWAGKPEAFRLEAKNDLDSLLPRNSFANWIQKTKYHSRPWSETDLDIANYFLCSYVQVLLAKMHSYAQKVTEYEQVSAIKDKFLGKVSHELRTPLAAIKGWIDFVIHSKTDEETTKEALGIIDKNVTSQLKLIEDLLDTSRITAGQFQLKIKQSVNLTELVQDTVTSLKPIANQKNQKIYFNLPPIFLVDLDPYRFKQIMVNLLTNALKFSQPDSIVLVDLIDQDMVFSLVVRDHGVGIEASQLTKIFEDFKQVEATKDSSRSGLGLGLSIVKTIVNLHHGTIKAESAGLNQGSKFTVTLPRNQTSEMTAETGQKAKTEAKSQQKIIGLKKDVGTDFGEKKIDTPKTLLLEGQKFLIAEDDDQLRFLLKTIIEKEGAVVKAVKNGMEAINACREEKFDLVFSDLHMPVADGYEFIEMLRTQEEHRGTQPPPAIAITAYCSPENKEKALNEGYSEFISKPVKKEQLISLIHSYTK